MDAAHFQLLYYLLSKPLSIIPNKLKGVLKQNRKKFRFKRENITFVYAKNKTT
jgi:hypothetical protein